MEVAQLFIMVCFVVSIEGGLPNGLPRAKRGLSGSGFQYSVNDYNGNEHSHQQQQHGNAIRGQYKVLLPDGRLQTVTYIADEAGYRAKVDYTPAAPGEATTANLNHAASAPVPVAVGLNTASSQSVPVVAASNTASSVPIPGISLPPVRTSRPATSSVYPGDFRYPPYPLYKGVSSYGPGLVYATPSSTLLFNRNRVLQQNNFGFPGFGSVPYLHKY